MRGSPRNVTRSPDPAQASGSVHLIGCAGSGMNALAQLAAYAGWCVSGSDRQTDAPVFPILRKLGIRIFPQDGSGLTPSVDRIVVSSAIENNNPDLVRARELAIPIMHRADFLAHLCNGRRIIAVAGTAGKSTVTALLGWIFECIGSDPTVYCGAAALNWRRPGERIGNVRYGCGPCILELDESDRSLLAFHPDHAIITNVAEDHFTLEDVRQLFDQFAAQVGEKLICGVPDPAEDVCRPGLIPCSLIGRHNRQNIRCALDLCRALGLDAERCLHAVGTFQGIERRLERIGPRVIDDFAHSPIKIAAALEAVSELWPRFAACWRPHGYGPLRSARTGLIKVFAAHLQARPADRIFILPVYDAGGTADRRYTSAEFVAEARQKGIPLQAVSSTDELQERLLDLGDPVLLMGARDPDLPRFARQLNKGFLNR